MGWLKGKQEVKATPPGVFGDYLSVALGSPPYPDAIYPTSYTAMASTGYAGNELVFACIQEKATSAPEAKLRVYRPGSQEPLDNHPLRKLIENPNPLMTEFELFELTVVHLDIAGSAFWWIVRDRVGMPVELWPMRPDYMRVLGTSSNGIHWGYEQAGSTIDLGAGDVIQFKYPNPVDPYFGQAPLRAAMRATVVDNTASDFVGTLLKNHAVPGVAIELQTEVDETIATRLKTKWKSSWSGTHRGEPVVLQPGMAVKTLGLSLKDLEFPDLRRIGETRICMSFGVQPILVGSYVGLSSTPGTAVFAEARKNLWEETLMPLQRRMVDAVSKVLIKDYIGPGKTPIELRFDRSQVLALRDSETDRWSRNTTALMAGGITVNDFRRGVGLPEITGGDVFYQPSGVIVVRDIEGGISNTDTTAPPPDATPPPPAKSEAKSAKALIGPAIRGKFETEYREALGEYFGTLATALRGKALPDRARWDDVLSNRLANINTRVSTAAGSKVASQYGAAFDEPRTVNWQKAHAQVVASKINDSFEADWSAAEDEDALDAVQTNYSADGGTVANLSAALTTAAVGWGMVEAGRQSTKTTRTKSWVTGGNARPEHAAMDGETVGIDETFSNGSDWPGDGADGEYGCNCGVDIVIGD